MNNWFKCSAKYNEICQSTGKNKKVTDTVLIDALSYTEAEARFNEILETSVSGEFKISGIVPIKITDLFNYENGDIWYKCKVVFLDIDEKTGQETRLSNTIFVLADTIKGAFDRVSNEYKTLIVPFEIENIDKTKVTEIYNYEASGKKDYAEIFLDGEISANEFCLADGMKPLSIFNETDKSKVKETDFSGVDFGESLQKK